jgi:hypothetical protein
MYYIWRHAIHIKDWEGFEISVHDNKIESYHVLLHDKQLVINTINEVNSTVDLIFDEVLAHFFEDVTCQNVIFDIESRTISSFVAENRELLACHKKYGWPTNYESVESLQRMLADKCFNYYVISCSSGLNGWILAKSYYTK